MYEIETRKHEPKNVFAGDFPTLPESGTAGAEVAEYMPVIKNENGKIVPVTTEKIADVVGISAAEAAEDEPIVYYMTGEFFADGLTMPKGVTVEAVKDALRKISIFLR